MILPTKHTNFAQSLLGLAGALLAALQRPQKVETLWATFQSLNDSQLLPAYHTYEDFILALDFLYLAGAIRLDGAGDICRETN